jgi:eukaryotic-like serine/threonine-protein kinase
LWLQARMPRFLRPDLPPWLQEIILRCLEPLAASRYPTAAHLAFDLSHPDQVRLSERSSSTKGAGFRTNLRRWFKAVGMHYTPSPPPVEQLARIPIVMVALPHQDVSDATLFSMREAVASVLGSRATVSSFDMSQARLACVTVIDPGQSNSTRDQQSETTLHRHHLAQLRRWSKPLEHLGHQTSCHVLEARDVADALLSYARGNNVTVIVMGAATHGLQLQRFVTTVPIKVAMGAPCSVLLVKQTLPFEALGPASSG